jgi:hypothetical protein
VAVVVEVEQEVVKVVRGEMVKGRGVPDQGRVRAGVAVVGVGKEMEALVTAVAAAVRAGMVVDEVVRVVVAKQD